MRVQARCKRWQASKVVALGGAGLQALPVEVVSIALDVHVLDLHDNALRGLPELGRLTSLRQLNLGGNQLTAEGLPDADGCRQLTCLLLPSNRCGGWCGARQPAEAPAEPKQDGAGASLPVQPAAEAA